MARVTEGITECGQENRLTIETAYTHGDSTVRPLRPLAVTAKSRSASTRFGILAPLSRCRRREILVLTSSGFHDESNNLFNTVFETSLKRLGADKVELRYLHWYMTTDQDM
ncbi:hypothetical protein BKA93DRAFT_754451 [Sparassis latifolia]